MSIEIDKPTQAFTHELNECIAKHTAVSASRKVGVLLGMCVKLAEEEGGTVDDIITLMMRLRPPA